MDRITYTAKLADLQARLEVLILQYENASWAMGNTYRERINAVKAQIAALKEDARVS